MKKIILFFIIFIFLASGINAEKIIQSQSNAGSNGYDIKYPLISSLEQGKNFEFNFHIFNKSNGVPIINDGLECYFHLYDSRGDHQYIKNKITVPEHIFDFSVYISGTNFTEIGEYYYIFQCNNTNTKLGGFISDQFLISSYGQNKPADLRINIFIFMFIIVLLIGFGVGIYFRQFKSLFLNKTVKTISYSCMILALIEFILMLGVLYADTIQKDITTLIYTNFILMLILIGTLILVMLFLWQIDMIDISETVRNEDEYSKKEW